MTTSNECYDVVLAMDACAWGKIPSVTEIFGTLSSKVVGQFALFVFCCVSAPIGCSASDENIGGNDFEISIGSDRVMCQVFAEHLQTLPPRPQGQACLPPLPSDERFSTVEFVAVDLLGNLDIVEEIELTNNAILSEPEKAGLKTCQGDKACLDALWHSRSWLYERALGNIEAGIYILRRTQIDLNGDSEDETVYQTRNFRNPPLPNTAVNLPLCIPWARDSLQEPDVKLFVSEADNPTLHQRLNNALMHGQLARYNNRLILLQGLGPSLSVLYLENDDTGHFGASTACSFTFKS